jgi:hypothetical protein
VGAIRSEEFTGVGFVGSICIAQQEVAAEQVNHTDKLYPRIDSYPSISNRRDLPRIRLDR